MDDTDRKLILHLSSNPRMSFRELAKNLGISKQAVHHRIQVLIKIGAIKGTTAYISVPYLDAIPMAVFGRSKAASIETVFDKLGESELTRRCVAAGGNYLYVVGLLREISELDSYAEFVIRTAEMSEPNVGIYSLDTVPMPEYVVDGVGRPKRSSRELTPLDFHIIASLKDDARRPVAEIAKMIGVSPKTVRRHLTDMMSNGSLDLSVRFDQPSAGDLMFLSHVNLRNGADKAEVSRRLLSTYPFPDAYIRTFGNIPGLLIWIFWTDKLTEMRKILRVAREDEDVLTIVPNFAFLERVYSTWRDGLHEDPALCAAKARPRKTRTQSGRQRPLSTR